MLSLSRQTVFLRPLKRSLVSKDPYIAHLRGQAKRLSSFLCVIATFNIGFAVLWIETFWIQAILNIFEFKEKTDMKRFLACFAAVLVAISPMTAYAESMEKEVEITGSVDEDTATEDESVIKVVGEDGEVKEVDLDSEADATGDEASDTVTTGETTGAADSETADINEDDGVTVAMGDVPYIAFGADLTDDQKKTVMKLMGIADVDLSQYDVVTVTNAEEHEYLDSYIDSATIGTKALSSVLIVKDAEGSGISVSTKNINYCTVGMYKNALATAGLTDAKVIVAGPFELSGTAALIGAMKAYSQMTGETVDMNALDIALDELVVTGSVRQKYDALSGGEAEELIAYLKGMVLSENLTDKQIKKLVKDGAAQYGVELSDDEIDSIVGFLDKLKDIDVDPNEIMGYAENLYDKFKDIKIDEETQNFFMKIINAIVEFFRKLFSGN